MNDLQTLIIQYLDFCREQKCLDSKTLKAYRIDLRQFCEKNGSVSCSQIASETLESYISMLHVNYKPKTAKRKIAALRALFRYLEYKDYIKINPFNKLQVKFREPAILPRTIPLHLVESLLAAMYRQYDCAKTDFQKQALLRDITVIEVLFSTGIRISELCSLKKEAVNLYDRELTIYGKGAKERKILIGSDDVIHIMNEYQAAYQTQINASGYFFLNNRGTQLSDQSVRNMIRKQSSLAGIELHITPHMFRHTFATCLLEADVDIRYIQEIMGHSSINTTEIYTHVTTHKQKDIMTKKHPRREFNLGI